MSVRPPPTFMSLRDYFAAQALAGLLAARAREPHLELAYNAELAYKMADAMLDCRAHDQDEEC